MYVLNLYLPVNERHLCENLSNEVLLFLLSEVGSESGVRKEDTEAYYQYHKHQGQEAPVLTPQLYSTFLLKNIMR